MFRNHVLSSFFCDPQRLLGTVAKVITAMLISQKAAGLIPSVRAA